MKVVVIGETCVDEFIYGEVTRISPEAPVPVFKPLDKVQNAGMSGNVVANLKALEPDCEIIHFTPPGNITKTRLVEKKSNHMFIRMDEGEAHLNNFEWTAFVDMALGEADIVIVSDYNKGYLRNADLKEIAKKSTLSILDSKRPLTDDIIEKYTFVKLNESERLNNPDLTLDNIITTLGDKGAEYSNIVFASPKPQETIDVSGAGDTFTSAFILKYYETDDVVEAIKFANEKSSEVVSKRGVAVPN